MNRICVFIGSSPGARPAYREMTEALGRSLAQRRIGLVYGGAKVGLMGVLADTILAHSGEAIGVIPKSLVDKEVAHEGLSELHIVDSMHARKTLMSDLSQGVVALPGGIGTLEEFFEMLTWAQLGFHTKPCGILNVEGYFDSLLEFLDHARNERFVSNGHRDMILAEHDPESLIDRMIAYQAAPAGKWLDRDST